MPSVGRLNVLNTLLTSTVGSGAGCGSVNGCEYTLFDLSVINSEPDTFSMPVL